MSVKPPRLTLRIACYTVAALLFAAGAILWFVDQRATAQAESQAVSRTHFIIDALLTGELTQSDFNRPISGPRRTRLDDLFQRAIASEGIVRMSLIAPNGLVTYSTEPSLIGQRPHHQLKSVQSALHGQGVREVSRVQDGDRSIKVLETYLPVSATGTTQPLGVFELYQDYDKRVAAQARKTVVPVAAFMLVALLVLCGALVPVLRRVTAAVEERNRRLVDQARKLERSLSSAQEARSEAESARRALAEQNKRLRELDRLKDEFLSLVSHELRTPLTSIRGYLDLVLDEDAGHLNPEQRRFLEAVDRNSSRLLRLVGDLLFVAQADAGRLSLEQAKLDVSSIAADCVEGAQPAADEKSIELSLLSAPVPALVGDRGRLTQVVDNLVSNALKFTPEGGTVEVKAFSDGEHVVVEVSDTGIGIPRADQSRLFERFFRSNAAYEQAIPGTGLGLAIVKAIVEAHRGRITVNSQEGKGTTFRVELPLVADSNPAESMEVAA